MIGCSSRERQIAAPSCTTIHTGHTLREHYTENCTDRFALDFSFSRIKNNLTLCKIPIGFTHFMCIVIVVSSSEAFYVRPTNCSSYSHLQYFDVQPFTANSSSFYYTA